MRNIIITLTLVGSLALVSAAWARGGEGRTELDRTWHEQRLQHKELACALNKTCPAQAKALRNYMNNLPRLWKAGENG
ncbi:MAG: hypothetical protein WBG50_19915 [Desulfomonilaceae bacterium]